MNEEFSTVCQARVNFPAPKMSQNAERKLLYLSTSGNDQHRCVLSMCELFAQHYSQQSAFPASKQTANLFFYRGSDPLQLVELWQQTHDHCRQQQERKLTMVWRQRSWGYYVTREKNSPGGEGLYEYSPPQTPGSSTGRQLDTRSVDKSLLLIFIHFV